MRRSNGIDDVDAGVDRGRGRGRGRRTARGSGIPRATTTMGGMGRVG